MARSHGRILTRIWQDDDFRHSSAGAQRLYMLMLSQPNLSHVGVIPLTARRWAAMCSDTSSDSVETSLQELHERHFVVVDWDTEEVFVRTLIRNDAIYKQPQLWVTVTSEAQGVLSALVRTAIVEELRRLPDGLDSRVEPLVEGLIEGLAEGVAEPPTPPHRPGGRPGSRARARTAPSPSPVPTPGISPPEVHALSVEDPNDGERSTSNGKPTLGQATRAARQLAGLAITDAWSDIACQRAVTAARKLKPDATPDTLRSAFIDHATWKTTMSPARFTHVIDQALTHTEPGTAGTTRIARILGRTPNPDRYGTP